jgi:hypothetical protein
VAVTVAASARTRVLLVRLAADRDVHGYGVVGESELGTQYTIHETQHHLPMLFSCEPMAESLGSMHQLRSSVGAKRLVL